MGEGCGDGGFHFIIIVVTVVAVVIVMVVMVVVVVGVDVVVMVVRPSCTWRWRTKQSNRLHILLLSRGIYGQKHRIRQPAVPRQSALAYKGWDLKERRDSITRSPPGNFGFGPVRFGKGGPVLDCGDVVEIAGDEGAVLFPR